MAGRKPRLVHRKRTELDLSVLHVEITKESHDFLRELAAAKQMPVGGYVDVWIKRKKKRLSELGFIQSDDSSLIS
jgi:hypothetical protein